MLNSEIAEKALGIIEEKGWTKCFLYVDGHGYCIVGAGLSAMGVPDSRLDRRGALLHSPKEDAVLELLRPVIPGRGPMNFNDRPDTEKQHVIDVLTDAAKYWRDRGQ